MTRETSRYMWGVSFFVGNEEWKNIHSLKRIGKLQNG